MDTVSMLSGSGRFWFNKTRPNMLQKDLQVEVAPYQHDLLGKEGTNIALPYLVLVLVVFSLFPDRQIKEERI